MNAGPPYGGIILIADTSARIRTNEPSIQERWTAAVHADQIATCSIVTMELLFSARDAEGVVETERVEATFRQVPVSVSVQRAAIGAVRKLSEKGAGYHRVPPPDALIAAAAQDAGIGVLHYDRHFDRLAEVLHFQSVWIAPPGSL
jgi:predicted nucleic acid-binding protein